MNPWQLCSLCILAITRVNMEQLTKNPQTEVQEQNCDLSQPYIADCTADITEKWFVSQNTHMHNVRIMCNFPEPVFPSCIYINPNTDLRIDHSSVDGGDNMCFYLEGSSTLYADHLTATNCGSDMDGGVIYAVTDASVTIENSHFSNPGVYKRSGAIFIGLASKLSLKSSQIFDFSSSMIGAAIRAQLDTTVYIENSIISGNYAHRGGALAAHGRLYYSAPTTQYGAHHKSDVHYYCSLADKAVRNFNSQESLDLLQ